MPEKGRSSGQALAQRAAEIFGSATESLQVRGLTGPGAGTIKVDLIGGPETHYSDSVHRRKKGVRRPTGSRSMGSRSRVRDLADLSIEELREMLDRADQTGYAGDVPSGAIGQELNRRIGK